MRRLPPPTRVHALLSRWWRRDEGRGGGVIVGAAIVPSAPLVVDGVSADAPDGVAAVQDAADAALDGLPDADAVVLLAAPVPGSRHGQGLYDAQEATLAGVGRADIARPVAIDPEAAERLTRTSQYPLYRGGSLPLGLSVLALLVGGSRPLLPLLVPSGARFEALVGVGASIAEAVTEWETAGGGQEPVHTSAPRTVVVAAGDLSAGLDRRSPLSAIEGARAWDDQVVDVIDSGRLDGLARLGPAEAQRVGALGWAPMAALHGVCARAKVALVRRHYSAPCGVGYLVAHGA